MTDEEISREGGGIHVRRKIGKFDEEGLWKMLDDLRHLNEAVVKKWIVHNWPEGMDLYGQEEGE